MPLASGGLRAATASGGVRASTASGGTRAPTEKPPEIGVAPTMLSKSRELPPAVGAISLAGITIPVPRIWIKVAAGIAAIIVLIAIAIVLGRRNAPETPAPAGKPASSPVTVPRDSEAALKALLYDLQSGKTCPDRKAVIPKIVELHDARAIPALKAARFNMHGGVLGVNQDNWNACLKTDAEGVAIKALGGSLK